MTRTKRKPQYVVEDGRPTAVIVDIQQYEEMLEKLDQAEDLAQLQQMRKRPLKFRSMSEFLAECNTRV